MLVLTRKCQEKIQIGENITITIVRVKGQSVRVGIEAPRDMKVLRSELPPESSDGQSPAAGACGSAQAAAGRSSRSKPRSDDRNSESGDAGRSPLAQYVPGTRMLAIPCGG
jgi:carbon storage regulator CsrA